jgi:predicted esterase
VTAARNGPTHLHSDGRIVRAGIDLHEAERAMILIHGRGATPESILSLTGELPGNLGFAFIAPGASESTDHPRSWYPHSFLAPVESNEPGLSSALARIEDAVVELEVHGIERRNILLLGFSQGACLALEYAVRRARRWGGVVALTGGLIGDRISPRDDTGTFGDTPVFLGCSDRDPHVPLWRVDESEDLLRRMGARVEKRIYPGLAHTVIRDELDWVEGAMQTLAKGRRREALQMEANSG